MTDKTATFLEYKALLFSIAYNMLGNVDAAEDIVQDTFLKWMEINTIEVRHTKAYLVKIVTNKSINYLHSARQKREQYVGLWLPEPLHSENPKIESYHALSIGFLILLEKLTPQERAIFLLKEVFAYDYYELAEMFEKTEDNCRQILKRAKANLGKDTRRFEVDLKVHEKILNRFLQAIYEGSMEELIDTLKEDIVLFADGGGKLFATSNQRLAAPPKPIYGRENVSKLLLTSVTKLDYINGLEREIIVANGLPSIISYSADGTPFSLISFELEGHQIRNIYLQINPEKLKHFKKQ